MGSRVVLNYLWIWNLVLGPLVLALTPRVDGLAISYCSPDLTNTGFTAVFNLYQTNDLCRDTCQGSYAFAVIQGQNCWCSNYIPSHQVSTYDCNSVCPGYPSQWCGNTDKGYYGYYALSGKSPSGTAGGTSASSSASSGSSVSTIPSSTGSPSATLIPSTTSSSSSSGGSSSLTVIAPIQSSTIQSSSIETSSRTPSSSSKPVVVSSSPASVAVSEPVTSSISGPSTTITRAATPTEIYTSITTVTGQVRTVIVTPTPSSDSTLGSGSTINSSGGGVSTGKVVGIVIGVALGIGLLIGFGVWLWLRRRHQRNTESASLNSSYAPASNSIPSRQVSQLSSAGLLGKAPRIQTSGFPSSSNPRSADTMSSNFDRRSLGTDQRLNPYAIYAHDESRHSNVSLQDNQDYSRQLRVANPDP